MELTPEEQRVLGCLVEKQLTTPQQYPLTLNALVLACNQTSNRDPVVNYDEEIVQSAVTRAKGQGLARFVHPSHGRSALRYRHELDSALGLDERQLALLSVLMLRGAQTPGELRARTDRMARFTDPAEVEAELGALAARQEPLVVRLPRRPGHKEDRYGPAVGEGALADADYGDDPRGSPSVPAAAAVVASDDVPVDLAHEVAGLRAEVEELRRDLDDLRSQLGA